MSDSSISHVEAAAPAVQESAVVDRRRPGRPQSVSPALLSLLRAPHAPAGAHPPGAELVEDLEDGNPPRAILIALAIMTPFWVGLGYLVFR